MNAHSHHKLWSTLKSAVFGSNTSLHQLVGHGSGELVCESVGKADLLSDHFDSKQSRESDYLLLTCHPSPYSLTTFAFRSSEVMRLLWDFDPYGGTDPFGSVTYFPFCHKRTANVIVPRLSVVFRMGFAGLVFRHFARDKPMSPQFQKAHGLLL